MYLTLGILALLLGPVIYQALGRRPGLRHGLDLLVTAVVTVLALLILWEKTEAAGWAVLLFALLGFFGPLLIEQLTRHRERRIHMLTLALAMAGLVLHQAVDGAALLAGDTGRDTMLAWGVVLHSLPAGLAVWWLVRVDFGVRPAIAVMVLMVAATLAGFEAATLAQDVVSERTFGWFQGFVAGSLLHLAFHRVRGGEHNHAH